MRTKESLLLTVTETSPAAASTVVGSSFKSALLTTADRLVIDAALLGATAGTLDVYLQRKIGTNAWRDWVHFPQLAAGASAIKYTVTITGDGTSLVVVGGGTDAAPGVALAVNTAVNVIPGGDVRIIYVAGASTSLGAAQTITITPYSFRA